MNWHFCAYHPRGRKLKLNLTFTCFEKHFPYFHAIPKMVFREKLHARFLFLMLESVCVFRINTTMEEALILH